MTAQLLCYEGPGIANLIIEKGGRSPTNEQTVIENGRALRVRHNRVWLKKTMRDPKNFDLNDEEFVQKAVDEARTEGQEMSKKTALKLFRLFRIRNSQALNDALRLYPEE